MWESAKGEEDVTALFCVCVSCTVVLSVVVFWMRNHKHSPPPFFFSEFLLQVAFHDPLLSLSSQLHCSSARRRTHTGKNTRTTNPLWNPLQNRRLSKVYFHASLSASQVAVTAVAMTFDREQTLEKLADKAITKGRSGLKFLLEDLVIYLLICLNAWVLLHDFVDVHTTPDF